MTLSGTRPGSNQQQTCSTLPRRIRRRDCAALARTLCRAGIMIDFDPERLHCVADSHMTVQPAVYELVVEGESCHDRQNSRHRS